MSLSDIRIAILFVLIVGFIAMFSVIFGIRGTYFILTLSAIANGLFGVFVAIANGKI